MIRALAGAIILAASIGGLRAMLPKDGQVHRWATAVVLESVIPLSIVTAFVIGVALIFSSFVA